MILSGLSRIADPEALAAICRCHDPAVANEVAIAAIAVARQLPLLDLEAIDAAMKTVAASIADEALRREAAGMLVPLFDGKSFAGWEGNLKTFRIEEAPWWAETCVRAFPIMSSSARRSPTVISSCG